jgi:ankyrin repeat protein
LTTVKYKGDDNLKKGPTPLYMASKNGHFQIVDMLLKRGANKNDYENKGYTALFAGNCFLI